MCVVSSLWCLFGFQTKLAHIQPVLLSSYFCLRRSVLFFLPIEAATSWLWSAARPSRGWYDAATEKWQVQLVVPMPYAEWMPSRTCWPSQLGGDMILAFLNHGCKKTWRDCGDIGTAIPICHAESCWFWRLIPAYDSHVPREELQTAVMRNGLVMRLRASLTAETLPAFGKTWGKQKCWVCDPENTRSVGFLKWDYCFWPPRQDDW